VGEDRDVTVPYEAPCPHCSDGPHRVELVARVSRGTLLFGGPPRSSAAARATASVTCPTTGEPFQVTVEVPVGGDERVTDVRVAADTSPAPPREDWRLEDMAEWRKASGEQARDAAAKLLAAGTASVGAYFAILKYVGGEEVDGWRRVLSVFPAVGYLAVCVLAAAALRPVLMRVYGPDDFERLREARLSGLNRMLAAAVIIFVAATAVAGLAFVVVGP
jgi:hypothetical protein